MADLTIMRTYTISNASVLETIDGHSVFPGQPTHNFSELHRMGY